MVATLAIILGVGIFIAITVLFEISQLQLDQERQRADLAEAETKKLEAKIVSLSQSDKSEEASDC